MQQDILDYIDQSTVQLLKAVSLFSKDNFNRVPFEGSWTAAQVCDHLYKAEKGIPPVLAGNSITTTRQPDEKLIAIESVFLDFSTKLTSPEFILPAVEPLDLVTLQDLLVKNRGQIRELAVTVDLGKTFIDVLLPVFVTTHRN